MAKTAKLPKTVLGITVPKQLRNVKAVRSVLTSPLGRQIVADVLVAAAGAAAAALTRSAPSAAKVADAGGRAVSTTTDGVQSAGGAIGSVLSEVARTILPAAETKRKPGKKKVAKAERKGKQPAAAVRHH